MSQDEKASDIIRKKVPEELEWQTDTPLFDRFVAIAALKLLIIFSALSIVTFLISPYVYVLAVLTLIFSVLVFFMVLGRPRRVTFKVDGTGAGYASPTRIGGANKIIGYLLLLLGVSEGRPGAFIVGITSASQPGRSSQGWGMEWRDVREVALYPRERVVLLKEKWFTGGLGGGLASLRLYCTSDNYEAVVAMAMAKSKKRIK